MTEYIVTRRDEFQSRAIPHLLSYLPELGRNQDLPIYFTAYVPPRAFAAGDIVINVAAPYWKGNADNILNVLVHEIFHAGYGWCRSARTEIPLKHKKLYRMLEDLQNEGMATYVAYKAVPMYPAPDEKDYELLESANEVTSLLEDINTLFEKVGVVKDGELQRLSWEIGVTQRGYYIVGAHMAEVIEETLGREVLIKTLVEGPISFVALYNSLVKENRRIYFPNEETILTRQAALQKKAKTQRAMLSILIVIVIVVVSVCLIWRRQKK